MIRILIIEHIIILAKDVSDYKDLTYNDKNIDRFQTLGKHFYSDIVLQKVRKIIRKSAHEDRHHRKGHEIADSNHPIPKNTHISPVDI